MFNIHLTEVIVAQVYINSQEVLQRFQGRSNEILTGGHAPSPHTSTLLSLKCLYKSSIDRWSDQDLLWRGFLPYWPGMFRSQFKSEMKNRTMSKCPCAAARCRAVWFRKFLLVGSQRISRVRNFTRSIWPFRAAPWRGVSWSSKSLHIGSQCFSIIRNFTMSICPFMAARWSGVHPVSSKHDGLQHNSLVKYLTMCTWPNSAA